MVLSDDFLYRQLKTYFGFNAFKGQQEAVIRSVLAGRDSFVLMPTGGGKSLCYQLPALIMEGTAVIVSPLIALMKNQVDAIRGFMVDNNNNIAHFLNSSLNRQQLSDVREGLLSGVTKLLYVAPESLTKEENIHLLKQVKISFYAIDEAHCISEWGHDFRPEYRRLRAIVNVIGTAPIIALTATATAKVQNDIQKNLGMSKAQVFKASFNRTNLYYEIRPKTNAVREIIKYVKNNPGKSGIIYCLSRKKVEELADMLRVNDIKALPYHAGMDAVTRAKNQDAFLMEDVDVIVATIAFGMGIDKPDVRFVIHYDIPKSLEGYYQETGRAGRDGGEGRCIAFYSYKNIQKLEKFMQGKPLAEQEIGKQLLLETIAYAETGSCRRKVLLNYFGEEYPEEHCGNCDNCLHPKPLFEAQDCLVLALKTVTVLLGKFKFEHIVNVITGTSTSLVKSYHHHALREFGAGAEKPARFWQTVLRQALILHLLEKEIENYGLIKITEAGLAFLRAPYPILLPEDHEYLAEDDDDDFFIGQSKSANSFDEELFIILKAQLHDLAHRLGTPPYAIFQDPSIEDMCVQFPITIDELKNCHGVGEGKAKKFGPEFIAIIKKYVEDKEIVRPQEMIVKSIINKSSLKVHIIQNIDRKVMLDDLALSKGLDMMQLLDEIEAIVSAGTKISIDYFIDQAIDEDKVDEIYEYFYHEAESDSVSDAMQALGNNYSEEEIRLVRLKFMSDMAN
ncbi:MAG: DNA helicase RecQ [Prevotellaceae bacterium]|jgi:ATP-dependent DNA helicase RecQ|nr:DNA helicase RecQ [Prevotellaceae bacterium]